MKLLLVANGLHTIISELVPSKIELVNTRALHLAEVIDTLQETRGQIDGILITDDSLAFSSRNSLMNLLDILDWLTSYRQSNVKVVFIVRQSRLDYETSLLTERYPTITCLSCENVRIPIPLLNQAFQELLHKTHQPPVLNHQKEHHHPKKAKNEKIEKKPSFFDRFKSKKSQLSELVATDSLTKELEKLSRGMSRVVAITGHRGAGLTSTAVNIASEASKRGLSVMLVDMDIEYRGTNMYFSSFHEQAKRDEEMNASLIRTLAKPQEFMTTAYHLKEQFWLSTLGYEFSDQKLIEQFYTSTKLVGYLSVLRSKFNLILLDFPLDQLTHFEDALIHIDVFGLCVPNNLYAILSTLRNVDVALDREKARYLNAKSKVVVTKYNERSRFKQDIFTPDKVSGILSSGLSECFIYEMKIAGHVPHSHDFDLQIETDLPFVHTSKDFEHAYGNILLRLMEGAS